MLQLTQRLGGPPHQAEQAADPVVADGQVVAVVGDVGVLGGQGPEHILVLPLLGQCPVQVAGLLEQVADPAVADGQVAAVLGYGGVLGDQGPEHILVPPLLGQCPGQVAGLLQQVADPRSG